MPENPFPYAPHLFRILLHGASPLHDRRIRGPVIDVLLSRKDWTPQRMTIDDEPDVPFAADQVLRLAAGRRPSAALLWLTRRRRPAYQLMMRNDETPEVLVKVPGNSLSAGDLPVLFDLGDALAAAFQPDIGWTHLVAADPPRPDNNAPPVPVEGSEEYVRLVMDDGSKILRNGSGAGCLGLRTYFGPYTLRQIPQELWSALPAPCAVRRLDWGGVCVDLTAEPWAADASTLRRSWTAATRHLKLANWFAIPEVSDTGYGLAVGWHRSGTGDPGGRLRPK